MAVSGMRDLSIIATPPARRLSVRTFVMEQQNAVIKEALLRELLRGGQVYYLHNEVKTIEKCARDLAELGYSALAIDMYGEGKHTEHPQDAMAFMQAATRDADAAKARFLAGLELLKRQPQTDPSQIAAIGYCFGGKIVLDMARQGLPLAGVASFHGALGTATPASKGSVKAKILVEHGSADSLVPAKDLDALKQELNAAGADYRVVIQDDAKHGFTNPDADAHKGHGLDIGYDRQADQRSWADLQAFLKDIFGQG
ncbi:dienelactone hydrolase family protein [Pseudomonas aeruginosa]|uniref:dienelactone hydrolase family protein n=1 Tax=Pseudomonas aeruginosa TaxID=287 RepID=UPI003A5C12F4